MKSSKMILNRASAAILAIGDELLTDRQDTNSQRIQDALAQAGIITGMRVVVPDDEQVMVHALKHLMKQASWIICCGGLGPTVDDRTRHAISLATGVPLQLHHPTVEKLKQFFAARKMHMPASNIQQAMIPKSARVLKNNFGTAPGFLLQTPRCAIAALPGPPGECMAMLQQQLLPRWPHAKNQGDGSRSIRVCGLSESMLQEVVGPIFEKDIAIQLGFLLDTPGEIFVKLRATAENQKIAKQHIAQAVAKVIAALGDKIVDTHGSALAEVVGRRLKQCRQTLAVAESCTGGLVASRMTAVAGCSAYFLEGAVTYSNAAKQRQLGVTRQALLRYGAVSREVALQMAKGIRKKSKADWGLSITGIAGPGGGSKNKPVGRVYIALAGPGDVHDVLKLQLSGIRQYIQAASASLAMDLLRRNLKK